MSENRTPNWQPVKNIPLIARHIDGMLEAATEQYSSLQEALPKPYVLDDYTVNRVIKVFSTQQNDLWLFDEQLQRWQAKGLSSNQRQEVARLQTQMGQLHQTITTILALAKELKEKTIEKLMAKSDLEIGLEALLKPPPRPKS